MFQMCESTKQAIEEELESTLKKKDESNDDDDDVDITELWSRFALLLFFSFFENLSYHFWTWFDC